MTPAVAFGDHSPGVYCTMVSLIKFCPKNRDINFDFSGCTFILFVKILYSVVHNVWHGLLSFGMV